MKITNQKGTALSIQRDKRDPLNGGPAGEPICWVEMVRESTFGDEHCSVALNEKKLTKLITELTKIKKKMG